VISQGFSDDYSSYNKDKNGNKKTSLSKESDLNPCLTEGEQSMKGEIEYWDLKLNQERSLGDQKIEMKECVKRTEGDEIYVLNYMEEKSRIHIKEEKLSKQVRIS